MIVFPLFHRPWAFAGASLVLWLLVPGTGTQAQSVQDTTEVKARVVDERMRQPLVGAQVTLLSSPDSTELVRTASGSDGFFVLSTPPGSYILRIESGGFETLIQAIEVKGGQSTLPAFVLNAVVYPLDPLLVEAERGDLPGRIEEPSARPLHLLAGERMAELEQTGVSFTSAVRELNAGLRVRTVRYGGAGSPALPCIESRRTTPSFRGGGSLGCAWVAIVINGVNTGMQGMEAARFVDTLHLQEWESVEFLSHIDAATRYGLGVGDRGALVLWTRGSGPHASKERGGGG